MTSKADSITMQPKNYNDYKDKLRFPYAVQEKLNGMKGIAKWEDGSVVIRFRSNHVVTTVPHINDELEFILYDGATVEGELYSEELTFNELSSLIKTTSKKLDTSKVHFHLFDATAVPCAYTAITGFPERNSYLYSMYNDYNCEFIHVVPYMVVHKQKNLDNYYDNIVLNEGGEGIVMHELDAIHTMGKVSTCLKRKPVKSDEFEIVGWTEGKGSLLGCIGAFKCVTKDGKEFKAKLAAPQQTLKELYEDSVGLIGNKLTVNYYDITPRGVPLNPVGKEIRYDI